MISVRVYDEYDYCVGAPQVPSDPLPGVVIWGDEAYIRVDPEPDGTPRYRRSLHFVIPETRETPLIGS